MGDAGSFLGSGVDFMSARAREQYEAEQAEIDRMREDLYNEQQQKNWQAQFDYQKELNEKTMEREDNATQRSVADFQAAGMNKMLAVGNQASAGTLQTYGGTAGGGTGNHAAKAQQGVSFAQLASAIMDNKLKQSMVGKTEAETAYTNQKTLSEIEETALKEITKLREKIAKEKDEKMKEMWQALIDEQIEKVNIMRHNLGIGKKWNLPVGNDPTPNNPTAAGFRALTMGNENNNNGRDVLGNEKKTSGTIDNQNNWLKLNNTETRKFRATLAEKLGTSKKSAVLKIAREKGWKYIAEKTGLNERLLQSYAQFAWY